MGNALGSSSVLPVFDFDNDAGEDLHPAIGLFFATSSGHQLVDSANPLPVTTTTGPGETDDDDIATGQTAELDLPLNYVADGNDSPEDSWFRLKGYEDDQAVTADEMRGLAVFGRVVGLSFPSLTTTNSAHHRLSPEGVIYVTERDNEPFEVLSAHTAAPGIAAAGTVVSSSITLNDILSPGAANSLGRTVLHGMLNYAGTASSVTVDIEISNDAGVNYITVDSFTVLSGSPLVLRDLSVALGDRLRITITNDDGANATGDIDYGFWLTQS